MDLAGVFVLVVTLLGVLAGWLLSKGLQAGRREQGPTEVKAPMPPQVTKPIQDAENIIENLPGPTAPVVVDPADKRPIDEILKSINSKLPPLGLLVVLLVGAGTPASVSADEETTVVTRSWLLRVEAQLKTGEQCLANEAATLAELEKIKVLLDQVKTATVTVTCPACPDLSCGFLECLPWSAGALGAGVLTSAVVVGGRCGC